MPNPAVPIGPAVLNQDSRNPAVPAKAIATSTTRPLTRCSRGTRARTRDESCTGESSNANPPKTMWV